MHPSYLASRGKDLALQIASTFSFLLFTELISWPLAVLPFHCCILTLANPSPAGNALP